MRYEQVEKTLGDARARIANPENWCKGAFELWEAGRPVTFCTLGAIGRGAGAGEGAYFEALHVFSKVNDLQNFGGVMLWNDNPKRTHGEVLAAFDKAIAYCQVQREPAQTQPEAPVLNPQPQEA